MAIVSLEASHRSDVGKGVARKLRAGGRVPGVYYGRGEESIPLTVALKDLEAVIESAEGSNVIVDLKLSGEAAKDRKVPIVLVGTPLGVKDGGGILEHLMREVEVECLPTDIPSKLEVDVSALQIGDSLHVSDLKVERGTILTEADRAIAAVVPPTVLEEVKPAEEAVAAEPEVIGAKKEEETEEGGKEGGKEGKEGGKQSGKEGGKQG